MRWRWWFCVLLISGLFVAIGVKLVSLHVVQQGFLAAAGHARSMRTVVTPSERGVVVDRHGVPLGVSAMVYDLAINPKQVVLSDANWTKVFAALGLEQQRWQDKINRAKGQFMYLKRQVSPSVANNIAALHLTGLSLKAQYRRFYNEGDRMAHVLGVTSLDGQGQEGLELYYNDWLAGEAGWATHILDLKGNVIGVVGQAKPVKPGNPIKLSIDRRIQHITYKALKDTIMKYGAASGSAIILKAKTGEILAMANYPSYNPNVRGRIDPDLRRNRSVTDSFEAGSILKPFAMASVLTDGDYALGDTINTHPGYYMIGKQTVRDHRNNGTLSLTQVLRRSSNVGISKLVLSLPDQVFPDFLSRLGFGQRTGIELPGEVPGMMPRPNSWRQFALATLSFGYGMAATNLQLANAYAVIANKGMKRAPTMLARNDAPAGEQVVDPAVADKILSMMVAVTETGGTAVQAQVPGYVVAGKTGTARKAIKGGYAKNKYVAVFAGIVPADDPQLVMVVMIDETHGVYYYGGAVAAPVFSTVMRQVLPLMGVLPLVG